MGYIFITIKIIMYKYINARKHAPLWLYEQLFCRQISVLKHCTRHWKLVLVIGQTINGHTQCIIVWTDLDIVNVIELTFLLQTLASSNLNIYIEW